jgi:hypothetical protein
MQSDDLVCPECGSLNECEHDAIDDFDEQDSIGNQRKKRRDLETNETPSVEMVTTRPVPGPGEVYNTYGPGLSNAKLWIKYGFSVEANPWDRVEVEGGWIDADGKLSDDLWRRLGGTERLEAALSALERGEDDQVDPLVRAEVVEMAAKVDRLCKAKLDEMERPDLTTLELIELRDVSCIPLALLRLLIASLTHPRRASVALRSRRWTQQSGSVFFSTRAEGNGPCTQRVEHDNGVVAYISCV